MFGDRTAVLNETEADVTGNDNKMAAIADRLQAKAYTRHCDAYRWLRQHYDLMLQMLSEHQPSWPTVAVVLGAEGVTGAQGRQLTGDSLRRVWRRVCRDMNAVPAKPPTPGQDGIAHARAHGEAGGRQGEFPA
jgi:hypothetical protein